MTCDPALPSTAEWYMWADDSRYPGVTRETSFYNDGIAEDSDFVRVDVPPGMPARTEWEDRIDLVVVVRNLCALGTDPADFNESGKYTPLYGKNESWTFDGRGVFWPETAAVSCASRDFYRIDEGTTAHVLMGCSILTGSWPGPGLLQLELHDPKGITVFTDAVHVPFSNNEPFVAGDYVDRRYHVGDRIPTMLVVDAAATDFVGVSYRGGFVPPSLDAYICVYEGWSQETEAKFCFEPWRLVWRDPENIVASDGVNANWPVWKREDVGKWDFDALIRDDEGTGPDVPMSFRVVGCATGVGTLPVGWSLGLVGLIGLRIRRGTRV